jgi:tripeptide aminopeptidase
MVDRDVLMQEGVAEKFMRYVRVNTESCDEAETTPSTSCQWDLAHMLAGELAALGLQDVEVDEHCFVMGRLPSNLSKPAPAVGFIAHLDTVPGIPGEGVKPMLHRGYQGGDIEVGHGVVLSPKESPALAKAIGCDIITSDGSTLLGTDDKAGIADMVQALVELTSSPDIPRPDVWVAFTPDEEIGKGVAKFPYDKFGAKYAYTLDGGHLGELSEETFNAVNGVVTIEGVSSISRSRSITIHCLARVTPGRSPTLALLRLAALLMKDDLPTLGMPSTAVRNRADEWRPSARVPSPAPAASIAAAIASGTPSPVLQSAGIARMPAAR